MRFYTKSIKILVLTAFILIAVPSFGWVYAQTSSCPTGDYDPSCLSNAGQSNSGGSVSQPNPGNSAGQSNTQTFTLQNPLGSKVTSLAGLIQTFVDVVSYILILFAVLMLVYTGLQYILAQGNSERIKELHKKLLWIVIGVAIVIGARLIVQIVINTLDATHVVNSSTLQSVKNAASGN